MGSDTFLFTAEKRRQLLKMVELAKQQERLQMDLLHRSFIRSENQLSTTLKRRKAEVKVNRTYYLLPFFLCTSTK